MTFDATALTSWSTDEILSAMGWHPTGDTVQDDDTDGVVLSADDLSTMSTEQCLALLRHGTAAKDSAAVLCEATSVGRRGTK